MGKPLKKRTKNIGGLSEKKIRAGLKKIRACPFSEATGPGLVHKKYFLGALVRGGSEYTTSTVDDGFMKSTMTTKI